MRASGILLPVSSLPGPYGIGCFSRQARAFVDWLADAGQTFWQILPLGPTGFGDSPYQSFSTFAGNPYFIDLEALVTDGLLTQAECNAAGLAGDPLPSIRSLAKALHISILTVQKAYDTLQEEGFIETTARKGCYVAPQNQDFYLEEQQKKIEEKFAEAITIARASGISLEKLTDLLSLMYEEDE